jgi:hypothetical protein
MSDKIINVKNLNREEQLGSHILSQLSSIRSLCVNEMCLENLIYLQNTVGRVTTTMWAMCPIAFQTTGMPEKEGKELYDRLRHQLIKEVEIFIMFLEKANTEIDEMMKKEKAKETH